MYAALGFGVASALLHGHHPLSSFSLCFSSVAVVSASARRRSRIADRISVIKSGFVAGMRQTWYQIRGSQEP